MGTDKFEPGRGYSKADWDEVDSPELTEAQLTEAKPFAEALPDLAESIRRSAGRPRLQHAKQAVTLRLSPQTLEKFESLGPDWRARMAEVLDKAKV